MEAGKREIIVRSVLRTFLREVLKDGQVDAREKEVLAGLTSLLKVSQETFDEAAQQVKQELEADPAAGSMDSRVFMRRISHQLLGAFPADEVKPVLARIGQIVGVAPDEVDSVGFEPASSGTSGRFEVVSREGVNYVVAHLKNDAVRTEAGAMRYYQGAIEMESVSSGGGVAGFFKAALSGETFHKPVYTGTGTLVLEPSLANYFLLELEGEEFILDQGAYWASEMGVEVSAYRNKAVAGLFSGEGWFQTSVKGKGTVVVSTPGPVEAVDLVDDMLVVDGPFAVARSASLSFEVSRSTKSLWGSMTSGEGLVNRISGTGRVYLAPVPNKHIMLTTVMRSAMFSAQGRK